MNVIISASQMQAKEDFAPFVEAWEKEGSEIHYLAPTSDSNCLKKAEAITVIFKDKAHIDIISGTLIKLLFQRLDPINELNKPFVAYYNERFSIPEVSDEMDFMLDEWDDDLLFLKDENSSIIGAKIVYIANGTKRMEEPAISLMVGYTEEEIAEKLEGGANTDSFTVHEIILSKKELRQILKVIKEN